MRYLLDQPLCSFLCARSENDALGRSYHGYADLDDHPPIENVNGRHRLPETDVAVERVVGLGALERALPLPERQEVVAHSLDLPPVPTSFGSKTARIVLSFTDSSTMLKNRRTGMYRHLLSLPPSVHEGSAGK
jgi:hypothetical protein